MATITLKGKEIHTYGSLPQVGSVAPAFTLTNASLEDVTLESFKGKYKVLNIVPSLDTPICAISAKRFNEAISKMNDTVLINISADLPFAQKRFCESEKLQNIITLSTMRSPNFGKDYGVLITDGPIAGLMSRAVIVLDKDNRVVYTEQVPEIAQEPAYDKALTALQEAKK